MTVTILNIGTNNGERRLAVGVQGGTVDYDATVKTANACAESCDSVNTALGSALEENIATATDSTVTASTSESFEVIASPTFKTNPELKTAIHEYLRQGCPSNANCLARGLYGGAVSPPWCPPLVHP